VTNLEGALVQLNKILFTVKKYCAKRSGSFNRQKKKETEKSRGVQLFSVIPAKAGIRCRKCSESGSIGFLLSQE
jgi:hypothetical protein